MTIILLCGGYATRLYPLTLNGPKSLLHVGGRTLLDRVLDSFRTQAGEWVPGVNQVIIVTSRRWYRHYYEWRKTTLAGNSIRLTCDETEGDADKLGAIADLVFAMRECSVVDNIMVISPDNLFTESLSRFHHFCAPETIPVVGVYEVETREQARNYGVVFHEPSQDGQGRVRIIEKPADPPSRTVAVGLYYYPIKYLTQIRAYLDGGGNPDAPGYLLEHFAKIVPIRCWPVPGQWFDIGCKEALDQAQRIV